MSIDERDVRSMRVHAIREWNVIERNPRTLGQSIADLVDNSIDAGASKVMIYFNVQTVKGNTKYWIGVFDDGKGIGDDGEEGSDPLHNALEFGVERDYEDHELGFFGVGLKNSTIPHSTDITVISKTKGEASNRFRRLSKELVVVKIGGRLTSQMKNKRIRRP